MPHVNPNFDTAVILRYFTTVMIEILYAYVVREIWARTRRWEDDDVVDHLDCEAELANPVDSAFRHFGRKRKTKKSKDMNTITWNE